MQTVIETEIFARRADKLFSAQERKDLIDYIAFNRMQAMKSPAPAVCGKNERADMTEAQKKAAKAFATAIKQAARQRRTK